MKNSARIGMPVRRKEDARLVIGQGRFSDDYKLPGQVYAAFARSPHAHARVLSIDTDTAKAAPGVIGVFTGADLIADGIKPITPDFAIQGPIEIQRKLPDVILMNKDGSGPYPSPYPLLAQDRVRFVGQLVAMVVAQTPAQAKEAAELIAVDYETLEPITVTCDAALPDAPRVWDEPSNVSLDAEIGDKAATDEAFKRAAYVVKLDTWIQRVTGVPMEARTATGSYDPATGRYEVYAGSGGSVRQRRETAEILGVPPAQVRMRAEDIGGNFGTKNTLYPEFPLVAWAAKKVAKPVHWCCERGEAFCSDYQGRDLVSHAELALDKDGNFLALRADNLSNLGAHGESIIPLRKGIGIMSGLYRIPVAHYRARAVHSTTPSTIPYRSAGRPEAMFIIERLIDMAADKMGADPAELRRRNLIPPAQLPYKNASGVTYDNGEYERAMDAALKLADWRGFAARKAEAKQRGKLRGIGIGNYIELTMGFPREWSEITVRPDGRVELAIGTQNSGQGHETSFAQCVSEWLGVPFESIALVQGDTDRVPVGGGSHSGRSMRMGGVVMGKASQGVIAKGAKIAAHVLEAPEADIAFNDGRFAVKGTNRAITLFEAAQAADTRKDLPAELQGKLSFAHEEQFFAGGFPYGSHVAEVEIDPETGHIDLVRYAAVDDVGRAINPMILHGQTHGGIVQGVGQALFEHSHYDPQTGQLLAASFLDYVMPRADTMPNFVTELFEVPSPSNPLGIRAGGEGGTTPALAVAINATVDALSEFGVTHIEMPANPEKIWRAIRNAKGKA